MFRLEDDEPVKPLNSLEGCRFGFTKTHVWPKATPALQKIWEDAKQALIADGAEVEEVDLPKEFEKLGEWHRQVESWHSPRVSLISSNHRRLLQLEGRASFLGDYLSNGDRLDPWILHHVNNETKISRKEQLESYDEIARLRPVMDEIAGRYTALVTPSVTDIAPVLEEPLRFTGDAVRTVP